MAKQQTLGGTNIDLAFEIMRGKLEMQNHAHNALEAKIGILFGFIGVITASAIVFIQSKPQLVGVNIFTIGLFVLFLSLFLLSLSSKTRVFLDPPEFQAFYSVEALRKDYVDLKNQVVADMKSSYQRNLEYQALKSRYYDHSLWLFIISIIILFMGVLEK